MAYSSDSDTSSLWIFDRNSQSSSASDACQSLITSSLSEESLGSDNFSDEEFVAVVGGLGYIGSHTCLELLRAGYNILVIDNLYNSFKTTYHQILTLAEQYHGSRKQKTPLAFFCEADYRDQEEMRKLFSHYIVPSSRDSDIKTKIKSRISGIIHFAAYKSVTESIEQPIKYYSNNVAGLIEFCAILAEFNIKTLIFSSSATVYGSKASSEFFLREEHCVHQTEKFFDHHGNLRTMESECCGLTNPYARSKWICEAVLSDVARADSRWAIVALRYFNPIGCDESGVLGENSRQTPTNLMPTIMQVLSGKLPALTIFGVDYPNTPDGTTVRDYIHVTDLARGHLSALKAAMKKKGFRTYNLGTGTGHSVRDIVKAVEIASKSHIPTQIAPRRKGDLERSVALPKRAEVELKWITEKSLNDACRDIIKFIGLQKES